MCTYNGAWASFDEHERGSLETGKVADMVMLSANPYEVPAADFGTIAVERLILSGKPYRSHSKNMVAALIRGLASKAKI